MATPPTIGMPPSGGDVFSYFGNFSQFIAHDMVTQLSIMLRWPPQLLLEHFKGIEFDNEPMVTGHVVSDDNWQTCRIVICRGLIICMWELSKLMMVALPDITDQGEINESTSYSESRAAATYATLMSGFWKGDSEEVMVDSGIRLSLNQSRVALNLMMNVLYFLVGHECSHIYYRWSQSRPPHCEHLDAKSLNLVTLSPFLFTHSASEREEIARAWSEEFFADSLGLELSNTGPVEELPEICLGAEFALIACRAIEAYETYVLGKTFQWSKTHPPLTYRLQMIRNKFSGLQTHAPILQMMFERYIKIAESEHGCPSLWR